MSKKAHFIESKLVPFESTQCDKCGLSISKVQDGVMFWNPSQQARDRNICRNCYDVWTHKKREKWAKWQADHEELTGGKQTA